MNLKQEGQVTRKARRAFGVAAAGATLLLTGCGGGGSTEKKNTDTAQRPHHMSRVNPNGCVNQGKYLTRLVQAESATDKQWCVEEVYPMGQTNVVTGTDHGEMGLIGIKLKVAGRLFACIAPISNPSYEMRADGTPYSQPEIAVENFSLRNDCFAEPTSNNH